jgi:predicted metal-dependent phosphoesterase TrpH
LSMNLIDLHTHSTASDGSYRPADVVRLAKDAGLKAMALTDHDTTDGLAEALAAGAALGVEVIPGVEISTRHVGDSMHILGYFLDFHSSKLAERLAVLKQARKDRNPKIIAKLNALGIPITMEQVEQASGGGQVGRPHIARVLLASGYVRSMQQAFDIYLKNGGKAYVAKYRFPPAEALGMIREAGGVPVLAHPVTLGLGSADALRELLRNLQALGLAGIETFYADHSPEQEAMYLKLAQELGLLVTGGSDFHGDNKPDVTLGNIRSRNRLTYDLVTALKAWRQKEYGLG